MLAIISLIFLLIIIGQLEADVITSSQAVIYGIYGLIMFYNTSKKYWDYSQNEETIKNMNDLKKYYNRRKK